MIGIEEFKNTIWMLLLQTKDHMKEMIQPFEQQCQMTLLQLRLIIELSNQESYTIGEMSRRLHVAAGNVSALCKKLEREKRIERIRDRQDERVVHISLTPEGKELIQKLDFWMGRKCIPILENTPREDFDKIIIGLEKLNEIFKKIVKSELDEKF